MDKGFDEENKALGDLIKTRQCKASIYSFDLVNRYAKKPKGAPEARPQPIQKAASPKRQTATRSRTAQDDLDRITTETAWAATSRKSRSPARKR